jgi:hypothetical protein
VHPDVAVAWAAEGPIDVALEADLGDARRDREPRRDAGGPAAVGVIQHASPGIATSVLSAIGSASGDESWRRRRWHQAFEGSPETEDKLIAVRAASNGTEGEIWAS